MENSGSCTFLDAKCYAADALHGDLSQAQRDTVMKKFRLKNIDILVATDVAARGLDVTLMHVIFTTCFQMIQKFSYTEVVELVELVKMVFAML